MKNVQERQARARYWKTVNARLHEIPALVWFDLVGILIIILILLIQGR